MYGSVKVGPLVLFTMCTKNYGGMFIKYDKCVYDK